jgi:outer membrane murein-binding lipoprotein Lpp
MDLDKLRKSIAAGGKNEVDARNNQEELKKLFAQKQQLLQEMNAAKKQAAEEAAAPFLAQIKEIDEYYCVLLTLTSEK